MKTYVFSFVLLLLAISHKHLAAQTLRGDTIRTTASTSEQQVRGVQYTSREDAAAVLRAEKPIPLFAGVSISVDVAGAVMAAFTPYGQYEASARINLRGRYFPTAEIGIGVSNHTNETTNNHYKVNAPYYRVGLDYNFLKNLRSGNRLYAGVRYGFTSFKYDVSAPDIVDFHYGTSHPFSYSGISGNAHWGEVLFGLEARVWGMLHLGWSVRYRLRFHNKTSDYGNPWYIPGYGKCDSHALGGTFNVIFDI